MGKTLGSQLRSLAFLYPYETGSVSYSHPTGSQAPKSFQVGALGLKLHRGQELLGLVSPPFFHLLLPSTSPLPTSPYPAMPLSGLRCLRAFQKIKPSQLGQEKHTSGHRRYIKSFFLFFFNSTMGFLLFLIHFLRS